MNATLTPYGDQEEQINLLSLLYELWGSKWLILLLVLLGVLIGTFQTMHQPILYKSDTLLQIDDSKSNVKNGGLAEQLVSGNAVDSAAVQIALMQSRFILESVVESLGLNVNVVQQPTSWKERLFPRLNRQVCRLNEFSVPETSVNKPFFLKVIEPGKVALYNKDNQLLVSGPMGKTVITQKGDIQFNVQETGLPVGTQFKVVKRLNGAVVKELSHNIKVEEGVSSGRAAPSSNVFVFSLKGQDKNKIVDILNKITEVARAKDAQKKSQEASQTLDFLEHQLPITKKQLVEAEKTLNDYRSSSGKIDIKIQTGFLLDQLAELDKQLNMLHIKEIEMRSQYKEVHPAAIAVDVQIAALKKQREELETSLKQLPASDQIAVNLMRDVEVKQTLYMLLLNKIQELKVLKAGTVSSIRILSYAMLPDAPIASKGRYVILGMGFLGFVMGVFYIFGRKFLSPRVEDPRWSEKHLNLPNVAIVPFCREQRESTVALLKGNSPLLACTHSKNLAVEALRSLRTSLQVTLACSENNIISILGVSPGVGKSFVSANLGYLLAMAGKRVLLVDSDLRKGTMHNYFNLKASSGLAELLTSTVSLEMVLKPGRHENLTIITRGHQPKNPAEILSGENFGTFISKVSKQYDVVLFDTAPVLLVTDPVLVASYSAINFLVVGAGVHQPNDLEVAFKRLKHAGVSVSGTIFNFHQEQMRNYYYEKYYNYSYYYGEKHTKLEA